MEGRTGARLLYAVALCALLPAAAVGQTPNCIPSCTADDSRFLVITVGGAGLETLTEPALELQVRSTGGAFEVGFFDGESRGPSSSPPGLWDVNSGAGELTFTLVADPAGDGTGTTQVAVFDGGLMADNDWTSFNVVNDSAAWSGTEYVYILRAEADGVVDTVRSAFKVRTEGDVSIEVSGQPFAFMSAMPGLTEIGIVYPGCQGVPVNDPACLGSLGNSTYDGDFPFYLTARQPQQELLIWDGDLDRGNYDGTDNDTDDFNTDNDYNGLPPWACEDPTQPCDPLLNPKKDTVMFEGVAMGEGPSTGSPPDDADPNAFGGVGAIFVRTGAVSYEVWGPNGSLVATNNDPSGNQEWELFRVASDGDYDAFASDLPAGIYEVRVKNLDLENLNVFRFNLPVGPEPSCDNGPDDDDDSDSDSDADSDSDSDRNSKRPTGLTFTYTGHSCADLEASNNLQGGQPGSSGDYQCSGDLDGQTPVTLEVLKKSEWFDIVPNTGEVAIDEEITLLALTSNKKLFSQLELKLAAPTGEVQYITLHTSCSQPLRVGDQFGSLRVFRFITQF